MTEKFIAKLKPFITENKLINIIILFFFILLSFSNSMAGNLLTVDENGLFNANLENVNLTEIKKFFEKNYGIKFEGKDFLFQTKITTSFEKLNLEEVLKQVLTKKNYAFTYNSHGKLLEVTLLPGSKNATASENNSNIETDTFSQKTIDRVPLPFQKKNLLTTPDTLPAPFQRKNSITDDITRFKPTKSEQKDKDDKALGGKSTFQVIINSPPGEKR